MANKVNARLAGMRRLTRHLADRLQADVSLRLWDGSLEPLGPKVDSGVAVVIRSPDAVRWMLFSPKLGTFFELLASGAIDVEGGSLLEVARSITKVAPCEITQSLDKGLVLKSLWPFLFAEPRAAAKPPGFDGRTSGERNDKAFVQFHYDVSNDFYSLFLDESMVYSCAYFARADMSLEDAQRAKLDMVCRRLRLASGERLHDIGCGWGALIFHAAQGYGVRAHGVTLSERQFEHFGQRIRELGLSNRVSVELRDYREVDNGPFDKIAQIELYEHTGLANRDRHFETIHRLLRPRGLYLHHSCTRRLTRDPRKRFKTAAYQKSSGFCAARYRTRRHRQHPSGHGAAGPRSPRCRELARAFPKDGGNMVGQAHGQA